MRFIDTVSPSSAVRTATAIALAVVLAGGFGAPLTANAGSAVSAGAATASVEASVSPSVDSSLTPGLDWMLGSDTATGSVEPTTAPAPESKRSVRKIIADTGRAAGLSTQEIGALMWLAYRESRFHPTSHSRSECHGLFQLSAGMAHGHPWKDPEWNTKRGIKYMRGRYGGVLQAKAFWQRHHWY